jgi:hypothetical protein
MEFAATQAKAILENYQQPDETESGGIFEIKIMAFSHGFTDRVHS